MAARLRGWLWPYGTLGFLLVAVMGPVWLSPALQAGGDAFVTFLPRLVLWRDLLSIGEFPFWNPYMLNGLPAFASPQSGLAYPLNWALLWLPAAQSVNWALGIHILLAGLGAAWCAGRLGASRDGQVLAGLAYGLGSATTARLWAGHVPFLAAEAWLPFATGLAARIQERRSIQLLALVVGVMTLAGQPEVPLFCLWWLPFWTALGVLVTEGGLAGRASMALLARALLRLMVAIGLGFGLAAVLIAPAYGLYSVSARVSGEGGIALTTLSLPPWHLLGLLAPQVFGRPDSTYWPGDFYAWHERLLYVGLIPLLAAIRASGRWRWVCWGGAALGLVLAFGGYLPFYNRVLALVPGLAAIRAPARVLAFVVLALALAAGLGIERLRGRWPAWGVLGAAALVALAGLSCGAWFPPVATALGLPGALPPSGGQAARAAMATIATPELYRASGLLLLAGLAMLLPKRLAGRALLVLAVLDLAVILGPYRLRPRDWLSELERLKPLQAYSHVVVTGGRGPTVANLGPALGVTQPVGYGSLYSSAYNDLVTGNAPRVQVGSNEVDNPVWGLLGVEAVFDSNLSLLRVIDSPSPPAWVAHCAWPGGAAAVRAPGFPRQACVARRDATQTEQPRPPGPATIRSAGAGRLEVAADGPGWLVTTQPWYPGWSAWLDGQPVPVEVVDGALVAIALPAGAHLAALRYRPAGFELGLGITLASAFALTASWWLDGRLRQLSAKQEPRSEPVAVLRPGSDVRARPD